MCLTSQCVFGKLKGLPGGQTLSRWVDNYSQWPSVNSVQDPFKESKIIWLESGRKFSQEQRFLQFFCQSTLATVVRVPLQTMTKLKVCGGVCTSTIKNEWKQCIYMHRFCITHNNELLCSHECNIHMFKLSLIIIYYYCAQYQHALLID